MNIKSYIAGVALLLVILTSCGRDPEHPGRTFMPDMTYHRSYQAYGPNPFFDDSLAARKPVKGTIPFGAFPNDERIRSNESMLISYRYHHYIEDTNEGYEMAADLLENPIEFSDQVFNEGKRLYTIFCAICHGDDGKGVGKIVENGAYPQVPSFQDRLDLIAEGQMFHSITYGRNLMGSYAGQVSPEERWVLIHYIQKLSGTGRYADEAEQTAEAEEEIEEAEDTETAEI